MTTRFNPGARRRERGVTLVMALILLVMLTMLALTSFNLGKSNLQVVSNMQHRDESIAAAQLTIEEVLSRPQFTNTPNDALTEPCEGDANTRCVDTNGDGTTDVLVALTPPPACIKVRNVKNTEIDPEVVDQRSCLVGETQSFGVSGTALGDSMCSDSTWEIHAVATDKVTEARVEVTQGIDVRVPKDDVVTSCGG